MSFYRLQRLTSRIFTTALLISTLVCATETDPGKSATPIADDYERRGNVIAELADKQGALTSDNQPVEIDNRGNARDELGDKHSAIADFEKAAELYKQQGKNSDLQDTLNVIKKLRGE